MTSIICAVTARPVCILVHLLHRLQPVLIGQVCHARHTSAHRSLELVYTDFGRLSEYSSNSANWWPCMTCRYLYWHSSSLYCLLRFIVYLTFLPVDADVLLPPTLWLFVRQRIATVGDRPFPVSAADDLNKLPDDVQRATPDEMLVASQIMRIMLRYTWTKAQKYVLIVPRERILQWNAVTP